MLNEGSLLLGVGGWDRRDDLDVDLVVSLCILRAARRERGRIAGRRENELNSATAPIAWSTALFAWSQESDKQAEKRAGQRKNSHHLEQKEPRDKQKKTQSSVHFEVKDLKESENKLKKFYSPRNKLDSTSSLRLDKDPR